MEPERIKLIQRERDRLKVVHEVEERHLTQVAAAGNNSTAFQPPEDAVMPNEVGHL